MSRTEGTIPFLVMMDFLTSGQSLPLAAVAGLLGGWLFCFQAQDWAWVSEKSVVPFKLGGFGLFVLGIASAIQIAIPLLVLIG